MLERTNEDHCATLQMIEEAQTWSKSHFDSGFHPHTFSEGELVLVYDQSNDKLGKGRFDSMWYVPYVIHRFLGKGAYILVESDDHFLRNPRNGLHLKRSHA